jgi:pimeloyl-ACP methyl ester carboxylesterase
MRHPRRLLRLAALLLLIPGLLNIAVTEWEHARNPVPGRFYPVGGRRMHIDCAGSGSPTVVIEVAASASWLAWQGVQRALSPTTRVCTYDRAGHGWSAPRSGSRDAQTIVGELHALLDSAAVRRPVVLAGHSAGGLYVLEYAREFPGEVAGMALMDASSPRQIDELPGWRASYEAEKRVRGRKLLMERMAVWSGWERLLGRCRDTPSRELQDLAGQYNALMCRPVYVGGDESEFMHFETSARQAERVTSLGDIPLLIMTRDTRRPANAGDAEAIAEDSVWDHEQEEFKKLTPRSWRVVARGAGHAVQHDRLDLVVRHMTILVAAVRGGSAPPYGSTVVE